MIRSAIIALALLLPAPLLANSAMPDAQWANTQLPDAAKEAQAKELMLSVRCLVCQGESVADSSADLAADMRALIRKRIAAGETPDQIRAWLVERYGNWITYDPPLSLTTMPLWIAPLIFLVVGFVLARGRFRKRKD